MRILAVDTTSRQGSVGAFEATQAPGAARTLASVRQLGLVSSYSDEAYSTRLFRQLEFLLAEVKLTTADFDLFAVAAGPGSFTGLRVGLTAVKGWAEIHRRPVAALSALEAMAFQVQRRDECIVAVENAGRGQVYCGVYERAGADEEGVFPLARVAQDAVLAPEELWAHLEGVLGGRGFLFATPDVKWWNETASGGPYAARAVQEVSRTLAPALAELAWDAAQRGATCDALTLDAHYVRRSDAELLFKG